MYGADYAAKVRKFLASRGFKESRSGTFIAFKAWHENVYGEGAQAQRKYTAFLAKPETKAILADRLEVFEQQSWRRDNYHTQCFSSERRASGVPLPAKVPQPVRR
jgi:hypothetical protein